MAMTGGTERLVHTGYGNGKADFPIRLYVYYKTTQSIETNTSTVTCGMYVTTPGKTQSGSTYDIGLWTDSNGSYVGTQDNTFSGSIPNFYGEYWLAENKTFTVQHNDDGTGTATINWKWGVYSSWGGVKSPSGSFTITLPQIDRMAQITSSYDFNDTQLPTVTYSNPLRDSADALYMCIADENAFAVYCSYRSVNKVGDLSYTFTKDDINALRNIASNNLKITFVLKTHKNGSEWADIAHNTFRITENEETKPSVSIACSPSPSLSAPFDGLYIQGKSGVKVTFTAQAKYNAQITSYRAYGAGIAIDGNDGVSGLIQNSGSVDITGTVTDSRGFTNSANTSIDVIPYANPYVAPYDGYSGIVCTRCDSSGTISTSGIYLKLKGKRVYSPVTVDGTQKNFCTVQYRYKEESASEYSSWVDILSGTSTESDLFDEKINGITLDTKKLYSVQIRAIDGLNQDPKPLMFGIQTETVTFQFGAGGNHISVGGYCDYTKPNSFQCYWDMYLNGSSGLVKHRFIEDAGEVGNFKYRKWSDGTSECWGRITFSAFATQTAHGALYYNDVDDQITFPDELFSQVPVVQLNIFGNGLRSAMTKGISKATDSDWYTKLDIRIFDSSQNVIDSTVNIFAVGKWK